MTAERWSRCWAKYSKFPLPAQPLPADIAELVGRYGRVRLERTGARKAPRPPCCAGLPRSAAAGRAGPAAQGAPNTWATGSTRPSFLSNPAYRGVVKQALIAVGYPAEDLAGYTEGAASPMRCANWPVSGLPFVGPRLSARGGRRLLRRRRCARRLRRHRAALRRRQDDRRHRGHGPVQRNTLVLTTSITAVKQWHREILDKTDLDRGPGCRVHRRVQRIQRDVVSKLTSDLVVETARIVARDLTARFGISRPRIVVAGLNPHAGEQGALGEEDGKIVAPAVKRLQAEGIDVIGPLPADTLFHVKSVRARPTTLLFACITTRR